MTPSDTAFLVIDCEQGTVTVNHDVDVRGVGDFGQQYAMPKSVLVASILAQRSRMLMGMSREDLVNLLACENRTSAEREQQAAEARRREAFNTLPDDYEVN